MIQRRGAPLIKAKICLVGEEAVGKTSLIRRFVLNQFDNEYIRTIGTLISKKDLLVNLEDGSKYEVDLVIWDIMGKRGFMELLRDAYFYKANGIIAVCDLLRKETVAALREWVDKAFNAAGGIPVEIFANKADLVREIAVTQEDLEELSRSFKAPYLLTSAKTGQNVERGFQDIATRVAEWNLRASIQTA